MTILITEYKMINSILRKLLRVALFDQLSSAVALKNTNLHRHMHTRTHTRTHISTVKRGSPSAGRLISGALDNNGVL